MTGKQTDSDQQPSIQKLHLEHICNSKKAIVHEHLASQKQLDLQRRESVRNKFSEKKKSPDPVPITEVHQNWWCLGPNIPNWLKMNGIIFIQGDQGIKLVLFHFAAVTRPCRNAFKRWIQNVSDKGGFKFLNKMKPNTVPLMQAGTENVTV